MTTRNATSGEVLPLLLKSELCQSKTSTILKTSGFEIVRIVISAGEEIPAHKISREITVHCLEGHVTFVIGDKRRELGPGDLLFLQPYEEHAVIGIENSSLLATILMRESTPQQRLDHVQEASEESFPASDPPAW